MTELVFLLFLLLKCFSPSISCPIGGSAAHGCSVIESSLAHLFEPRPHSISIAEFGGVGDGVTLNTRAFQLAVDHIKSFAYTGGSTLYVPKGLWLTGCFNLTSHMTLFLEHGATILASQSTEDWPVVAPLPSYGRGRELPGDRYGSLLHGEGITDVVITGNNGTFDGQGLVWWTRFKSKTLKYTRGHMVEFMYSSNILLYNITFINPPFWTIHPVYSRYYYPSLQISLSSDPRPLSSVFQTILSNVMIKRVTVLAPHKAPNTDGVDPDSSSSVCIQECYIDNGDDAVAVKSGWDEYGILFNRPSHHIFIHNITVVGSHGISLGSEMSGGIHDVQAEHVAISEAVQAIHVKTSAGRGAYIANASFANFQVFNTGVAISFTGIYGDHPDNKYNLSAFARIENISFRGISGSKVNRAGDFRGVAQAPFRHICFEDINLEVESRKQQWNCSHVEGFSKDVFPAPCSELEVEPSCSFVASCA